MKIYAQMGNGHFLVEASESELAQIMGFASNYTLPEASKPKIGREVKVCELYQALAASRERKAEIARLADQLRQAAKRVDSINEALAAPIVEVEVKA